MGEYVKIYKVEYSLETKDNRQCLKLQLYTSAPSEFNDYDGPSRPADRIMFVPFPIEVSDFTKEDKTFLDHHDDFLKTLMSQKTCVHHLKGGLPFSDVSTIVGWDAENWKAVFFSIIRHLEGKAQDHFVSQTSDAAKKPAMQEFIIQKIRKTHIYNGGSGGDYLERRMEYYPNQGFKFYKGTGTNNCLLDTKGKYHAKIVRVNITIARTTL